MDSRAYIKLVRQIPVAVVVHRTGQAREQVRLADHRDGTGGRWEWER